MAVFEPQNCQYFHFHLISTLFQAEITKLMSQLRINVGLKQRNVRSHQGYRGGLEALRKSVTALIANERIELNEQRAITVRQYTEKLISDAILYGDKHKHTMEMATWWLEQVSWTHSVEN